MEKYSNFLTKMLDALLDVSHMTNPFRQVDEPPRRRPIEVGPPTPWVNRNENHVMVLWMTDENEVLKVTLEELPGDPASYTEEEMYLIEERLHDRLLRGSRQYGTEAATKVFFIFPGEEYPAFRSGGGFSGIDLSSIPQDG